MFTGIISHLGRFSGYRRATAEYSVEAPGLAARTAAGDSVAVNGVCLSVIRTDGDHFVFNLSRETVERTNLAALRLGASVNLELPLTLATPLGGHLVSGHIDFVAKLRRSVPRAPGRRMVFALPAAFRPFVVEKGSVAVNGVSLTIAAVSPGTFDVEVIPVTLAATNLGDLAVGGEANIECDMIGKYVYNWLSQTKGKD
jgi:riboflavin synthase